MSIIYFFQNASIVPSRYFSIVVQCEHILSTRIHIDNMCSHCTLLFTAVWRFILTLFPFMRDLSCSPLSSAASRSIEVGDGLVRIFLPKIFCVDLNYLFYFIKCNQYHFTCLQGLAFLAFNFQPQFLSVLIVPLIWFFNGTRHLWWRLGTRELCVI